MEKIGVNWGQTIGAIDSAVHCLKSEDFSQPIKPYLRYRDLTNRIIAMPAFVGGDINFAGIKWIASFPKNHEKKIDRAHSVLILNESSTGRPKAVINSGLLSAIRTASVSGFMIKKYLKPEMKNLAVGMTGFGPIGKTHLDMLLRYFGQQISSVKIFDLRGDLSAQLNPEYKDKVSFVKTWEEAYLAADIFLTCTVSSERYINKIPKKGSLQLNVSLRDFDSDIVAKSTFNIVDDWSEVCRQNTDIEFAFNEKKIRAEDATAIKEFANGKNHFEKFDYTSGFAIFNPMGMAAFDIAIASYYYKTAISSNVGVSLED